MSHEQVGRKRTVCTDCELAFYARSRGCPYCDSARSRSAATVAETKRGPEQPTDSVFTWRLKRTFGI